MAQEHRSPPAPISGQVSLLDRYQQIVAAAGYVTFTCDAEGIFTHVSDNVADLTGFSVNETVGSSFQSLVHPEWVDRVAKHYLKVAENIEAAGTTIEFPILTADKEERWVEQIVVTLEGETGPLYQAIVHDVTPRKRHESRLRTMVDSLPTGAVFIEGDSVHINSAAEAILGYGPDEAATLDRWYGALFGDRASAIRGQFDADRLAGVAENRTLPVARNDGATRQIDISRYLSERYEIWLINDVTESQEAAAAHKDNERRFRGLFDNNNDAVFFFDLDGVIQLANQQAADMLGRPLNEIIGSSSSAFLAEQDRVDSAGRLEKLLKGQPLPLYELTFVHSDGHEFLTEVNVALAHDEKGQPLHIQSIVRDISERQRTEDQLAERVNQLTVLRDVDAELADRLNMDYVLTMALDSAMRLSAADAGFIGLLGEDDALRLARIMGDYPMDEVEAYIREGRGLVDRVMRSMEPTFLPDVSKDPDYVPVRPRTRAQITVPLASQERLIGVLNLETSRNTLFDDNTFDIARLLTARIAVAVDNARLHRQTEKQLNELTDLYDRVSTLEQLKSDMIRIASHDLRNPLATILGYAEIMRYELEDLQEAEQDTGELPDFIEQMEKAANHMRKIISDILSLERIEQAAQDKDYVYFDLTDLVSKTYADHEPQARLVKHTITLNLPDKPATINGDPVQLGEAIGNLISNAIKYTPANGVIDVRLVQDGENALFEVEDNGYGIPDEEQDKLFQPFYRAQTDETAGVEGTGLGLHLVKNIIERHNGNLWFESDHGKGSVFSFIIPLAEAPA